MRNNILRVSKGGLDLVEVQLTGQPLRIGRDPTCDGVLRSPDVHPVHFLISWKISNIDGDSQGGWVVQDVSEAPLEDFTEVVDLHNPKHVTIGDGPAECSGYFFSCVSDALASQHFGGGFMKREVAEANPLPEGAIYPQKTTLLFECARVNRHSSAMTGLAHFGHDKRGKITKVPYSSPVKYRWINENKITVFFNDFPDMKVFTRKSGGDFTAESGSRALQLSVQQHILIRRHNSDIYLRLLPASHEVSVRPPFRLVLGWFLLIAVVSCAFTLPVLFFEKPELSLSASERTAEIEIQDQGPIQLAPEMPLPPVPMSAHAGPAQIGRNAAQEFARQSGPTLRIRAKSKARSGLNAPALDAGVNSVGILGVIRREGQASTTRIRPDLLVVSDKVAGKDGAIPMLVPRAGSVEMTSRDSVTPDDELQMASSTLSSVGSNSKNLSTALSGQSLQAGGGLKRRPASNPKVPNEGISISGGLAKDAVLTALSPFRPRIRECYERVLAQNSRVNGKVSLRWYISTQGRVTGASVMSSEAKNGSLENCVLSTIKGIPFPISPTGAATTVLYTFVFKKSS